jgi:uncharacterized protein YhfF
MIFQQTYQLILDNKKTATRRLVNPNDRLLDNPKRVETNGRTKWQVGRSYAIQPGRGQTAVGRIRITDINKQPLGQMTTEDAVAEGYPSLDDFRQTWLQIHDDFDPDLVVWVLTFTREPTAEEKARAERLAQETWLQQMAQQQREKLTAVGHDLGEWEETGDLKLRAKCARCEGEVTISAGKMSLVGYIPLMKDDECLADNPVRMAAIEEEWNQRLGKVYALLIAKAAERRQRLQAISDEQ